VQITKRALGALLAVLVLAVAVAACGSDEESTSTAPSTSGGATPTRAAGDDTLIQKDPANAGKKIVVGSKNFPEQYILGEIYAQALEAAGFKVEKQLDIGAEQLAFKALKNGTIDAYPEYTGTALTSFYKVKTEDVPRDENQAFEMLKGKLAEDKVTPLAQTPFENTYVVVSTKETAEKYGNPKTLSELVEKAGSKVSISGFPECRQRTDCLLGVKQKYGWNPEFVSSQGQYADLDAGEADFTFGFGTDGPLSTGKYYTYEDDKQYLPPYNVTLLVRDDALSKLGDSGRQVIEKIQAPLDEKVMQELNARVSVDKEKPEDVAAAYLEQAGFVK